MNVDIPKAIRDLRYHFGEGQQAFAVRLGVHMRSISNYEKDRMPDAAGLAALVTASIAAGRDDLRDIFRAALIQELGFNLHFPSDGKRELLLYLIQVAQRTTGGEVWRALFAEMLAKLPQLPQRTDSDDNSLSAQPIPQPLP